MVRCRKSPADMLIDIYFLIILLGEVVAKMELYMFLTAILSKFTVAKGNGWDNKSGSELERIQIGLAVAPKPYPMRFIPRKSI